MRRIGVVACALAGLMPWPLAARTPVFAAAPLFQAQAAAGGPALSAQAVDELLAPVALYPDQLLAQMLMSATEPAEVTKLDAWLKTNPPFKGASLQDAAKASGFGPSLVTLVLFPQVVTFMAKEIQWTTDLGRAFSADRGAMESVQRLRSKGQQAGTLKSTPQQTVKTVQTDTGQSVIVIEPANPQVVYVPQYNAQTVYTQAPVTNTVVVQEKDDDTDAAVAGAVVGFAAGIAIGAAMDNDYYYGPYGWHGSPYMYGGGWDNYYDEREDAREDYYEHREDAREDAKDIAEERGDRAGTTQQQRTERQQTRQENGTTAGAQQTQRRTDAQASGTRASGATASSYESRGKSRDGSAATAQRSGSSDAFSGYSSGRSERSASARGQSSRSRSSGGGSRGGGGGGGRRR